MLPVVKGSKVQSFAFRAIFLVESKVARNIWLKAQGLRHKD
jgi:hypothetical protein